MTEWITKSRWNALRGQPSTGGITYEPVEPTKGGAWLGVDDDGRLHLFLGIPSEPDTIPQEVQAIAVQVQDMDGLGLVLDAHAPSHYEGIFTTFASQVLEGVLTEGRSPESAVVDALGEFKSAFQNVVPEIKPHEQVGLFGELAVLSIVFLDKYGSKGVHLWSGPDKERHDFVGDFANVEVKTTTQREHRHEISLVHQLTQPPKKHLLLASVGVEKSKGGEQTIANLIDEVRAKLGTDGKAIDTFEKALHAMKWREELRQTGELLKFNLSGVDVFEVNDGFPRLPPNFVMPKGMVAVRYTIDVSTFPALDMTEVADFLDGKR